MNGTVTIQSPNAPISGQIQPLGKTPLIATSLLNQHCASLAGGEFSSFTVAGRDSLPTEPGSWLASPLAFGSAGFSAGAVAEGGAQARVIDPAQKTTVLSLRQIAPAGFLTQAFAVDWSAELSIMTHRAGEPAPACSLGSSDNSFSISVSPWSWYWHLLQPSHRLRSTRRDDPANRPAH